MSDISMPATYARHKAHAILREKANAALEDQDSLQKRKQRDKEG
jgi:hypothetical protein